MQILRECRFFKNETVRLLGNYVENVDDTALFLKRVRVLNIGQICDYQTAVFTYRCWNVLCLLIFFFRANRSFYRYCDKGGG